MARVLCGLLAALGVLGSAAHPAWAWDAEANRAVAALAYQRLAPAAKARVDDILAHAPPMGRPGCRLHSLADAADLMQCLHGDKRDFMRGVVYDPVPLCGQIDRGRACRDGRCASDALKRELDRLKAPGAGAGERAEALAAVAYLTAELHQPLHAADNDDRSGDRVRVTLPGSHDKRLTLYSVWDEDLPPLAIGDADTGLRYLGPLAELHAADWRQGDIDAWVADSHHVAAAEVYGRLPDPPACGKTPAAPEALSRAYVDASVQVVRAQLAKAAVRLAVLLEAALG